ncbi:MAG: hypothetical protein H7832_07690, partial [Magnetococcus sp. DMHC-6]
MAQFFKAFERTIRMEGGYSNDPMDRGGETYIGISRVFNPHWSGWPIIDRWKSEGRFHQAQLSTDPVLRVQTRLFYKQSYWDPLQGDRIKDESVAQELFDTAVNMGVHTAGVFLQESLNVLNRNKTLYPDMIVDGLVGHRTMAALEILLDH